MGPDPRDHCHDFDWQGTDPPTIQQIVQAMAKARDHDHDLALYCLVKEFGLHAELRPNLGEARRQITQVPAVFGLETDTHEEVASLGVVELGAIGDVAALLGQVCRDGSDDAATAVALNTEGKF